MKALFEGIQSNTPIKILFLMINHLRDDFDLVEIDPDNAESYGVYCAPLIDFPMIEYWSSGGYAHE